MPKTQQQTNARIQTNHQSDLKLNGACINKYSSYIITSRNAKVKRLQTLLHLKAIQHRFVTDKARLNGRK